ncbi:NAD(P)H-flavin reductase [Legionella sp. W05-934-2]|jgi:CDP-4-dehydro-6-deoxyglucose reductase|uniref:NAD(P)H-flavin reductase n=1 Tax=Legionella sp. W05-934-2 TaxID=1198649 RepID=UPI003462BC0A
MTKQCQAKLIQISPLTNSIIQIKLNPDIFIDYQSGQYLNILLQEEALSFSIANAPLGGHYYELHIRHSGGDPYHQPLFAHLKQHGSCLISLPFGECYLGNLDPQKPIVFIAGGTGFAPIKAMIEEMLAHDDSRQMMLFWGAREACDIYQQQLVCQWQNHVKQFKVKTLLDNKKENLLVKEVLKTNKDFLSQAQFVISGPFPLVYSIRDQLVHHGLSANNMHSDAFAFEC